MSNWNYLDIAVGYNEPVADFSVSLLYEFSTYNQYLIENTSRVMTSTLGDCDVFWDFGNGTSTSTSYAFTRNYTSDGTYTIVLTITDPLGRSNSISKSIVVSI